MLCLGYIAFDEKNWEKTKDFFNQAYFKAKQLNENDLAEQCLCNAGIASGNMMMTHQKQILDQFYRTTQTGFGRGTFSQEESEEEDEEEEDQH
mmetsp:Transcript_20852/g.19903  ORF Transcript_20852/g.19903 Transcript_20852/m.19903 type:complete len:93 (-) Transcript_20852:17-295(-)